jgi:hypothetical protein
VCILLSPIDQLAKGLADLWLRVSDDETHVNSSNSMAGKPCIE